MDVEKIENPIGEIRELMVREFEEDEEKGEVYSPKTIFPEKFEEYKTTLKAYFKDKTLLELTTEVDRVFINRSYVNIKSNSHETLAEGQFEGYYQRAVCKLAISQNKKVKISRWKDVREPKNIPGFTEGTEFDPEQLYKILRESKFPKLGPNSGLTIEII